jgi:hypothetical protein
MSSQAGDHTFGEAPDSVQRRHDGARLPRCLHGGVMRRWQAGAKRRMQAGAKRRMTRR